MNAQVSVTYRCAECGDEFEEEEEADCCCLVGDDGKPIVSHVELERMGQQRLV
jgi:hypothetical protein